ncbi:MAG TPA: glycosyltransferase family 4 protein [Pirellulaceae bacterium]|nr:glycosyltransferase family 4 protein [Pirellulaceae bacterium]HMP70874.1 glycosyltransferase family 4 protein [Pirellulaceae bacterium]
MESELAHSRKRVAHLTSVHARFDNRIFLKQCGSLAKAGLHVTLIVADGAGDAVIDNINIIDVGRPKNRWQRAFSIVKRVVECAKRQNFDLYQFHDPEFLPYAKTLIKTGAPVIYDSHEDFPKQILSKPYLNWIARQTLSQIAHQTERLVCPKLSAILCATIGVAKKFKKINPSTYELLNFPRIEEFDHPEVLGTKPLEIAFIGGITKIRGVKELVDALPHVPNVRLNLAGSISEPNFAEELRTANGWGQVNELGFLNRNEVVDVLGRSRAGVVTFLPYPNHIEAQPNKMFEYMAAELPVIASDFPLWREIIESNECGMLVDPAQPKQIAAAIQWIIDHPQEAAQMGRNGRRAIEQKYNWSVEEEKLIRIYQGLLK